jgi:trans-2,3-dihydro-3-hydroxyanthranilate isomerase
LINEQKEQQITKEINYSETTFILFDSKSDGGYDVRIFTPFEQLSLFK